MSTKRLHLIAALNIIKKIECC